MIRSKLIAGAALVLMAVLAMPSMANARAVADGGGCVMTPPRVQQNQPATFECAAGTFLGGEPIRFTITGANGARVPVEFTGGADVALNGNTATTLRRAGAHGGVDIRLRALGHDGGAFTLTASGASRTVTSKLTVLPADGGADVSDSATSAGPATVGSRADSVFGWVVAIIVVFAAAAFLADKRSRTGDPDRGGPAEA